jgi:uncharacterized membrane protein
MTNILALRHDRRFIFATMIFSALISLVAAFVLSYDALKIAEDSQAVLSCDINAVISCGSVARSWQANLFGFPNAFLGLMAEPVVITLAAAALGGVRFPRWFMLSAQVMYTLGLVFAYWLFYQSYFIIGALCPWCLLVTLSTTLVFASLTHINIIDGNLFLPKKISEKAQNFIMKDYDLMAIIGWIVFLGGMVFFKYIN